MISPITPLQYTPPWKACAPTSGLRGSWWRWSRAPTRCVSARIRQQIAPSLNAADAVVFLHRPELPWDAEAVVSALQGEGHKVPSVDALIDTLKSIARDGDHIVFMSNGGFEDAPRRCLEALHH